MEDGALPLPPHLHPRALRKGVLRFAVGTFGITTSRAEDLSCYEIETKIYAPLNFTDTTFLILPWNLRTWVGDA